MTCGGCASACPISGVDGIDPRKLVRMAVLGLEQEILDSQWPWKCTMCGKCERACPQNVEIVSLVHRIRSLREKSKVPGPLHKGVLMCLARGNSLGIPREDFERAVPDLVKIAFDDPSWRTNPRMPLLKELESLLWSAYEGRSATQRAAQQQTA